MKKKNYFLLFIMLVCIILSGKAQTAYFVTATGSSSADGLSWATATTLDNAISKTTGTSTDVIFVKKGTYTAPSGNGYLFDTKNIVTVYGNCDGTESLTSLPTYTDATSIQTYLNAAGNGSGGYLGRVLSINKGTINIVGFDMSGGDGTKATSAFGLNYGGVVYSAGNKGTIKYCKIHGGISASGGGIYLVIYASYLVPQIDHCEVYENTSTNTAGGVYIGPYVLMTNCIVRNNQATGSTGGIYNNDTSVGTTTIANCIVKNNSSAKYNGGIFHKAGYLVNTLITGNSAATISGGISLGGSTSGGTTCQIINCTISKNICNTDISTDAGGLNVGEGFVYNCIIWGNYKNGGATDQDIQLRASGGTSGYTGVSTVSNSCYNVSFINPSGTNAPVLTNVISTDPIFNNDATGDFSLYKSSPCINAGNNNFYSNYLVAFPSAGTFPDLNNKTRISGTNIDLGAYEFQQSTGIEDLAARNEAIYSSKKGSLTIKSEGNITIYDVTGKIRLKQLITGSTDFTLPTGVYFVNIPGGTYKTIVY